jgi:hypothetical protein
MRARANHTDTTAHVPTSPTHYRNPDSYVCRCEARVTRDHGAQPPAVAAVCTTARETATHRHAESGTRAPGNKRCHGPATRLQGKLKPCVMSSAPGPLSLGLGSARVGRCSMCWGRQLVRRTRPSPLQTTPPAAHKGYGNQAAKADAQEGHTAQGAQACQIPATLSQ